MDENKIKASLALDKELWKRFQIYCIQKDVTLSAEIERLIRKAVESHKGESK